MTASTKRGLDDLFADAKGAEAAKETDLEEVFKAPERKRRRIAVRNLVVMMSQDGKIVRNDQEEEDRLKTTVFVDNIPNDAKTVEIKTLFKKCGAHSEKIAVRLRSRAFDHESDRGLFKSHKLNALKGKLSTEGSCSAYVYLPSQSSYESALKLDGTLYLDHTLRIEPAHGGADPFEPKVSLFFGNLLLELTDDELRKFIVDEKNLSGLNKVRLIRDPVSRKGKGFGFAAFATEAEAKTAFRTLNGSYLRGRELRVKHVMFRSKEKDDKMRKVRTESAPVKYKEMVRTKKAEKGAADRHKAYKDRGAINSEKLFEGKRARKSLTKELTNLTRQWKSVHSTAAAAKAKKKIDKEKRNTRKEKNR
eukprot:TRINITY_DN18768_c0_g1_i2.p1 TRINITY_DN18768_c0_g1~~TRINITY_DN18768_c0_g1_i2.p1  ORF type:complete len:380 (+),score=60.83 TRINITY_DN18768_c0_g1_i2:54-1142(+)